MGQSQTKDGESNSVAVNAREFVNRIFAQGEGSKIYDELRNLNSEVRKSFEAEFEKYREQMKDSLLALKDSIVETLVPIVRAKLHTFGENFEKEHAPKIRDFISTFIEVVLAGGVGIGAVVVPGSGAITGPIANTINAVLRSEVPIVLMTIISKLLVNVADKSLNRISGGDDDGYNRYMGKYVSEKRGGAEAPQATGIIAEFAESITADARNQLIDDLIAIFDQLGFKSTASDRIEKLKNILEKINSITIKEDEKTQRAVCDKIVGALNSRFGTVINPNVTDIKAKCNQIGQYVVSLMHGTHVTVAAMSSQINSSISNATVVLKFARDSLEAIKNELNADTKLKVIEHFAVIDTAFSEFDRNLNNLKNILSVKLHPTEALINKLVTGTHFYKNGTVKVDAGVHEMSHFLKQILSGTAVVALIAAEFQRAATQLHISMQELNSDKAPEILRDKFQEQILKMKPSDYEGIKSLEAMHAYIAKYLPYIKEINAVSAKTGSDEAPVAEFVGGAEDEELSASQKRLRAAAELGKLFIQAFQRSFGPLYERMCGTLAAISMKVGTEIPLSEQLDGFREMLDRFDRDRMIYNDTYFAMIGAHVDARSKQDRDSVINQVNMMISYLDAIIADPMYASSVGLFKDFRGALADIIATINRFTTEFAAKFTDAGYGAGKLDKDAPPAFNFKHALKFSDAIEKFDYFYRVAQMKNNLVHTGKELEKYAEKYEELLAKSVATKITEIGKDYQDKLNDIKKHKDLPAFKSATPADQKAFEDDFKAAEAFALEQYECRKKFWNTLESIDAYMRHFTAGIVRNPSDIKEIKAMLDNVEIQEPWYNESSGAFMMSAFDNMQAYNAAGDDFQAEANAAMIHDANKDVKTLTNLGIPFVLRSPRFGKFAIDSIKKAIQSMRLLKNFMMLFVYIGDKFGGAELYKKNFMTPTQIYNNVANYLSICSFMQGHQATSNGLKLGEIRRRLGLSNRLVGPAQVITNPIGLGDVAHNPNVRAEAVASAVDPMFKVTVDMSPSDPLSWDKKIVAATGQTLDQPLDLASGNRQANGGTMHLTFDLLTGEMNIADANAAPFTLINKLSSASINEHFKLKYGIVFRSIPLKNSAITFNNVNQAMEDQFFVAALKAMAAKVLTTVGAYDMFERPAKYYSYMPVRMILGGAEDDQPKINDNVTELYYRLPLLILFYKKLFLYDESKVDAPNNSADKYVDYQKAFARYNDAIKITMIPDVDGVFGPLINHVFRNPFFEQQYVFTDDDVKFIIREVNMIHSKLASQAEGKDVTMHIIRSLVSEVNRRYGIVQFGDKAELEDAMRFRYSYNKGGTAGVYNYEKPMLDDLALLPDEDRIQNEVLAPSEKWIDRSSKPAAARQLSSKFNVAFGQRELLYKFRCMLESDFRKYWSADADGAAKRKLSLKQLIKDTQNKLKKENSDAERMKILGGLLRGGNGLTRGETLKYLMFHETVVSSLNAIGALYSQIQEFVSNIMRVSVNDLFDVLQELLKGDGNATLGAAVAVAIDKITPAEFNNGYEARFSNNFGVGVSLPLLMGANSAGIYNGGLDGAAIDDVKRDGDDHGLVGKLTRKTDEVARGADNFEVLAAKAAERSVFQALSGCNHGKLNLLKPTENVEKVETFKRFVFDKEYMMKVLIETLYGFSNDLQGLVNLRIENGKFVANFEKLREAVTEMMSYASYFIEFFRPHFDRDFLNRYIDKLSAGSLYWYQEQLVEKIIDGRKPLQKIDDERGAVKEYVNLQRVMQSANQTYEFLTQKFKYGYGTNPGGFGNDVKVCRELPPADQKPTSYDKIFAELIYYNAAKPASGIVASTEAPKTKAIIADACDATAVAPYDGPKFVDYLGRENQVEMLHFHSAGEKRILDARYAARFKQLYTFGKEFTYNRSLMFMFNQLLAKYLAQMFDGSTQKAYSGAFSDLFGSPMSQSITDQKYTWPDTWPCVFLKFGKAGSADMARFTVVNNQIEGFMNGLQDDGVTVDYPHSKYNITPGSFTIIDGDVAGAVNGTNCSAIADDAGHVTGYDADANSIKKLDVNSSLRRVAFRKKYNNDRFSRYDLTKQLFMANDAAKSISLYGKNLLSSYCGMLAAQISAVNASLDSLISNGAITRGTTVAGLGAYNPTNNKITNPILKTYYKLMYLSKMQLVATGKESQFHDATHLHKTCRGITLDMVKAIVSYINADIARVNQLQTIMQNKYSVCFRKKHKASLTDGVDIAAGEKWGRINFTTAQSTFTTNDILAWYCSLSRLYLGRPTLLYSSALNDPAAAYDAGTTIATMQPYGLLNAVARIGDTMANVAAADADEIYITDADAYHLQARKAGGQIDVTYATAAVDRANTYTVASAGGRIMRKSFNINILAAFMLTCDFIDVCSGTQSLHIDDVMTDNGGRLLADAVNGINTLNHKYNDIEAMVKQLTYGQITATLFTASVYDTAKAYALYSTNLAKNASNHHVWNNSADNAATIAPDNVYIDAIKKNVAPAAELFTCWLEIFSIICTKEASGPNNGEAVLRTIDQALLNGRMPDIDNIRTLKQWQDYRIGTTYDYMSAVENTYRFFSYLRMSGTISPEIGIKVCEIFARGDKAQIDALYKAADEMLAKTSTIAQAPSANLASVQPEYKDLVAAMSLGENDKLISGIEKENTLQLATDKPSGFAITQLMLQKQPSLFTLFGEKNKYGNYDWGNGEEFISIANGFRSWNYIGPLMDPDRERILFTSISVMLKNLQTSRHPSTQAPMHLTDSIADLPSYLKERMKIAAPGFRTLFQALDARCSFIKNLLETQVDVTRSWDHCSASNAREPEHRANAPMNNPWPGKLLDTTKSNADTKVRFKGICEAVHSACTYMIKCCDRVIRDVADDPKYLELYDGSIKDYKAQNGVDPLMPLTSSFDALTGVSANYGSHKLEDESKYLPIHNFGNSRFKLLYGMRHLWYGNTPIEAQHIPGYTNLIAEYNGFASAREQLPKDKAEGYMKAFIKVMRRLNELKNIRGLLTPFVATKAISHISGGVTTIDDAFYDILHSKSVAFYRHKLFNDAAKAAGDVMDDGFVDDNVKSNRLIRPIVVNDLSKLDAYNDTYKYHVPAVYQIAVNAAGADNLFDRTLGLTESTFKNERIAEIANYVARKDVSKHDRLDLINIMDMNIIPINVHALMRDIPFANIYNYAYTFDRLLVEMMYGKNAADEKHKQLCEDFQDDDHVKIDSTRDMFVKLMLDPYRKVNMHDLHVRRIMNGDNDMPKLGGRPKFLSDQIYSRVLFGSVYATKNEITESGPRVQAFTRTVDNFVALCDYVMSAFMGGSNPTYNLEWIWGRVPAAHLLDAGVGNQGYYHSLKVLTGAAKTEKIMAALNELRQDLKKYYKYVAENPMTTFKELYLRIFSTLSAGNLTNKYGGTLTARDYTLANMSLNGADDMYKTSNPAAVAVAAHQIDSPAQFIVTLVPLVMIAGWNSVVDNVDYLASSLSLLSSIIKLSNPVTGDGVFGMKVDQRNHTWTNVAIRNGDVYTDKIQAEIETVAAGQDRTAAALLVAMPNANVAPVGGAGANHPITLKPMVYTAGANVVGADTDILTLLCNANTIVATMTGALSHKNATVNNKNGDVLISSAVKTHILSTLFNATYVFNAAAAAAAGASVGGRDNYAANVLVAPADANVGAGGALRCLLKVKTVLPNSVTATDIMQLTLPSTKLEHYIQAINYTYNTAKFYDKAAKNVIEFNNGNTAKAAPTVGAMRFNTVFVRNMIFINNLYRVLTSKFRADLLATGQGKVIQKSLAIVNPKMTEFTLNQQYGDEDE